MTGSWDRTARLWDLASGHCLQILGGEMGLTEALFVTPDRRRMVTGSDMAVAKLWDLETGRCMRTFSGHTSQVSAVALPPEGQRLVTGSWDNDREALGSRHG